MTQKAIFYHAGCPVCVAAENKITDIVDRNRVDLEVVHLGDAPHRIDEASAAGVKSVPALVVDGAALHINHGADLADLR
ncbi:MAG: thioredoxin family protein [Methyloceanibacter sp.]|uniref:thioredoxin family protein n=1 Tax=Methyloceanibacter sp. TaxID=1965321 RepID=UPI001D2F166E|nr:thioredoxin family protein [Methyloceanibacter sp.]MCB1441631.1 thioredoxin family protein [Methyloceanibacter sp.]MCC0058644.1 thioredoxin family protein [Hyphomicrobiaceae bacterium]